MPYPKNIAHMLKNKNHELYRHNNFVADSWDILVNQCEIAPDIFYESPIWANSKVQSQYVANNDRESDFVKYGPSIPFNYDHPSVIQHVSGQTIMMYALYKYGYAHFIKDYADKVTSVSRSRRLIVEQALSLHRNISKSIDSYNTHRASLTIKTRPLLDFAILNLFTYSDNTATVLVFPKNSIDVESVFGNRLFKPEYGYENLSEWADVMLAECKKEV